MKSGIFIPEVCPRERNDCYSLAQIVSACGGSFICCGHNDGSTREESTDRFRICFKNNHWDEISDNNEQDMFDMQSVLAQAISADWHIKQNEGK